MILSNCIDDHVVGLATEHELLHFLVSSRIGQLKFTAMLQCLNSFCFSSYLD